jgi:hypothetical protein
MHSASRTPSREIRVSDLTEGVAPVFEQELDFIQDAGDVVRIGAMTRQRSLEFSALVAEKLPLLSRAIQMVGHLPTRSRGTIGGSLANADSAAELPMVLQVLEGEVLVIGPKGQRAIKARDLFVDSMITTLEEDEILTEIRIPVMPSSKETALNIARREVALALATVVDPESGISEVAPILQRVAEPVCRSEDWHFVRAHRCDRRRVRRGCLIIATTTLYDARSSTICPAPRALSVAFGWIHKSREPMNRAMPEMTRLRHPNLK